MAERVLFHVVGQIIGWLGSSAAEEIGSIWRVDEELTDLKNTLSAIRAVLVDAEERQLHSRGLRNWLERLENVVYHVDDVVDQVSTEQHIKSTRKSTPGMRKAYGFLFSSSNQCVSRRKMARRVRKLRKALDKIAADRRDFNLEALSNEKLRSFTSVHRDTHSSVIEESIIGREADKIAILRLVLNERSREDEEDRNVSVVPIVGIGGLGKTALAQIVFNDERVEEHFELRTWVWVSANFDVKSLVEKIITSATHVCPKDLEMEQLQRRLRAKMDKKRCLLVLDDVWNESAERWGVLRDLLAKSSGECRVVVTTRSEKVAEMVGTVEPYRLDALGEEKSWSLFSKVAFGREAAAAAASFTAVGVGKQIVKKCGGIPLAIKAVGGLLRYKHPESEWPLFVQRELLEISNENENDIDNMLLQTLKLSYDQLPSHLKHCFAYCSLFPKGHKIDVEMLIQLWVAQGFVDSSHPSAAAAGEALEVRGRRCFMELLWRSFFQEVARDEVSGDVKTCRMHDLMHDLAILIAGKKCAKVGPRDRDIEPETRHLSFHFHIDSFSQVPTSWTRAKRARSILLPCQSFNPISETFSQSFCDAIALHFKFVRTLELKKLRIKIVPESIGELIHLRYIDLSVNWDLHMLPDSITKLFNLQTLKLNHCRLKELPRDIKKLANLRHLEIRENRLTRMPSGLGALTQLRTLSQFVLREDSSVSTKVELNELFGLNNLRGLLEIRNLRDGMESDGANFKEKWHLQSLHLHWGVFETGSVDHGITLEGLKLLLNLKELTLENYKGFEIPTRISSSFPNLIKFELRSCANCRRVLPLNQLHYLKTLKLENMPNLNYITEMSRCGSLDAFAMPSLRNLELYYLPNLIGWSKDVATCDEPPLFPRLSRLRIFNCPKLISMPVYPFIEELVLENTSWDPFEKTLSTTVLQKVSAPSSSNCSSIGLFKLRTLVLGSECLQSLPSLLPRLTSLNELQISHCPKLEYLSSSFQHLPSLETLKIRNCEELDILNDKAIRWKLFRSLRFLSLNKLPKLVTLPEELQYVTTLDHLEISHCTNLSAIPDWIRYLRSLATLEIWECPNLTSLPEAIRCLASLETLIIYDCPILFQRCQRGGEDWPKIAKIPVIDLW